MGDRPSSSEVFTREREKAREAGSATYRGEQRKKEGKGLHEMINPSSNGVIRRSISQLGLQADGTYVLIHGTAMLEETRLDTTSSMGNNVDIALEELPKVYDLLTKGPRAVLGRYDGQFITAIFGDVNDDYVLCRSHAEMGEKIAEQMTLMVPERAGGDWPEDPQYGIFGSAYLTNCAIRNLGLKSYDFTVTDAAGRDRITLETLQRVFGNEVLSKCAENGFELDPNNLPQLKEVFADLLKVAHAFILLVPTRGLNDAIRYWAPICGQERLIVMPDTRLLPATKAAIIGLTEGVLDLDGMVPFLMEEAGLDKIRAEQVKRSVAGIPIGAQAMLENFDKVPLKGDIFANKGDLWPIKRTAESQTTEEPGSTWK